MNKEIKAIADNVIVYPKQMEEIFTKLKLELSSLGYHHPIGCSDKDGLCDKCTTFMLNNYHGLSSENQNLLKLLVYFSIKNY